MNRLNGLLAHQGGIGQILLGAPASLLPCVFFFFVVVSFIVF